MVETFDKGVRNIAENATPNLAVAPPELVPRLVADKHVAAAKLAASDEKMVKDNLLPPLPNFPAAESLAGGSKTQTFDANQKVTSETTTLSNSLIPGDQSTDLKQHVKFDANGAVTSTETSWKDAQNRRHDVLTVDGTTTNTIVDGSKTEKLITRADVGGYEHDVIEKSPDGKRILSSDKKTIGAAGHLNFEDKFTAETKDGKFDLHRLTRWDKKQKIEFDHSKWLTKDGVVHEADNFNYGDKEQTNLRSQTAGDVTTQTKTDKDHPSKTIQIHSNGDVTEDGVTRNANGEVIHQTW